MAHKWTEESLVKAIDEVKEHKTSLRQAALKYDIPKSTLSDYVTGKVEVGRRPGPPPVLTADEEKALIQWAVEMSRIGYGQTRRQICEMVMKIIEKDHRPNPFIDNRPGKDWWYALLKRNEGYCLRTASPLELPRAIACTKDVLLKWYTEFEQFLIANELNGRGDRIWNCDESGFPLSPKSGKVLAPRGTKTVYRTCSAKKEQITTLVAVSASGGVIPPFHIFPGERFSYNPLENSVEGAYFGRSSNGWITSELFYGWVVNHFTPRLGPKRPVVLLFDQHSTHIDLITTKFCKENSILLYCLPAHSSHITQPLDVGFFKPLKINWAHAVDDYRCSHIGQPVTKRVFAKIFRKAWIDTVKVRTIVNGFAASGVYPVDKSKATGAKVAPSAIFATEEVPSIPVCDKDKAQTASLLALKTLEQQLDEQVLSKFRERFEENYDVPGDPLYNTWLQLKLLANTPTSEQSDIASSEDIGQSEVASSSEDTRQSEDTTLNLVPGFSSLSISSSVEEILTYPEPIKRKSSRRGHSTMPPHLTSDQFIHYLEEKKRKKDDEEKEKTRKRAERQAQRERKQAEKELKKAERERKKAEKATKSLQSTTKHHRRRKQKGSTVVSPTCDESNPTLCPCCGEGDESRLWVQCDVQTCQAWYHVECTDIESDEYSDLESITWFCDNCC